MFSKYGISALRIFTVGAALLIGLSSTRSITAQQEPSATPYRMILTSERAMALVEAADRRLNYVPGEVVIKFKEGVTAAGQQRALRALRSRPAVSELRWVADVAVYRDSRESDATILAAQLSSQPEVQYAEPNYLYRPTFDPNDPGYASRQWNFRTLDLPRAWDINPGANATLIVAVVDTGITAVNQSFTFATWNGRAIQNISVPFRINPDLSGNRLVSPQDFAFWEGPVLDMEGHGTHVSSTVGEDANNNLAEAGIAYNVRIMPVKVCLGFWEVQFILSESDIPGYAPLDAGGCALSDVAQGIRYAADNGARVINISLGGTDSSLTVQSALLYAAARGSFVAIAAGNDFEEGNPVEYPAVYAAGIDGVMSVGSVGPSLRRAFYSSTASQVEIAAPGGSSREGGAQGLIWQSTIMGSDSDAATVVIPRFDRYAETPFQGTSMAAPHVSGIAALIISQGVTSPAAVEAIIKKTARDLGTPGRDDEFGYGLIQPRTMLFGFGIAR